MYKPNRIIKYVIMYFVVGKLAHSLAGPIIGALILTFISEYFRIAKEYGLIITSVFIVFIRLVS